MSLSRPKYEGRQYERTADVQVEDELMHRAQAFPHKWSPSSAVPGVTALRTAPPRPATLGIDGSFRLVGRRTTVMARLPTATVLARLRPRLPRKPSPHA